MVLQINDLNRREGGEGRLREKFKSTDNLGNSEYEIQCDGSPTGQHFNLLSSRSLPASLPQICCFVGFLFFLFVCFFFLAVCRNNYYPSLYFPFLSLFFLVLPFLKRNQFLQLGLSSRQRKLWLQEKVVIFCLFYCMSLYLNKPFPLIFLKCILVQL